MITTLKNWYKTKTAQCDPMEVEQANIRIILGMVIFLFSTYSYFTQQLAAQEFIVFKINLVFEVLAAGLLFVIVKNKSNPPTRRIIGAWLDIGTATVFMSLTHDIGVALVIVAVKGC